VSDRLPLRVGAVRPGIGYCSCRTSQPYNLKNSSIATSQRIADQGPKRAVVAGEVRRLTLPNNYAPTQAAYVKSGSRTCEVLRLRQYSAALENEGCLPAQ